jgi:hypothetical protein
MNQISQIASLPLPQRLELTDATHQLAAGEAGLAVTDVY